MSITLRSAGPADLEHVVRLFAQRAYLDLPVRNISGDARRRAAIQAYQGYWPTLDKEAALKVTLAERDGQLEGMLVTITGMEESITGDRQTQVYDHYLPPGADPAVLNRLLAQAEELGRRAGDQYLVVELAPGDPDEARFAERGFIVELNRIGKRVEEHELKENPRYTIREAVSSDHMFVCYLNSLGNQNTIPAGRDHDPDSVSTRYLGNYFTLKVASNQRNLTFICDLRAKPGPADDFFPSQVGYLMVKTGYHEPVAGQEVAYIYDLAVHPDHWGRRATQLLMRTAESHIFDMGLDIFTGDISERNPRALKTAIKSLGFTLEYRRWGKTIPTL